jgi:hypothetical protein
VAAPLAIDDDRHKAEKAVENFIFTRKDNRDEKYVMRFIV